MEDIDELTKAESIFSWTNPRKRKTEKLLENFGQKRYKVRWTFTLGLPRYSCYTTVIQWDEHFVHLAQILLLIIILTLQKLILHQFRLRLVCVKWFIGLSWVWASTSIFYSAREATCNAPSDTYINRANCARGKDDNI